MLGAFSALAGNIRLNTVVIDAGHGGKDSGAVSKDKETYEKTLTLSIAGKLEKLIKEAYPDVKVVMTRSTDRFVELRDRAKIANKAAGNLFISIHINSSVSSSPNGYSVHILGQSSQKNRDLFAYNMDVVKRENSVILLEDDYHTKYQGFDPSDEESYIFMQLTRNSFLEQSMTFASIISDKLKGGPVKAERGVWQNPFYVLWSVSMPSVLVELGFISNDKDLAQLRQDSKRDDIAGRLFLAFKDYKDLYDNSVTPPDPPAGSAAPAASATVSVPDTSKTVTVAPEKVLYGTQIIASSREISPDDSLFCGYVPVLVKLGSLNKYIIGVSESPDEARKENEKIKEKHPTSFMVKISEGTTSRFK